MPDCLPRCRCRFPTESLRACTFQVLVEPLIMTEGGPNNATLTVLLQVYNYAFKYFWMGEASAMSMMLFLILLALTLVYFRFTRRFEAEG